MQFSGVRCTGTIDVPKHVTSPLCTPNMVVPRATHLVFRTTLAVSSTVTHGARNKTTCLPTANTKHSLSHVGGPGNEIIKEISHVLLCVPASSISCSTLLMWLSRVWISQAHAIIKHVQHAIVLRFGKFCWLYSVNWKSEAVSFQLWLANVKVGIIEHVLSVYLLVGFLLLYTVLTTSK